jgi:hypothetical protein
MKRGKDGPGKSPARFLDGLSCNWYTLVARRVQPLSGRGDFVARDDALGDQQI